MSYSAPTPYLIVKGAADAIAWYSKAFDATEQLRLADDAGHIMHAEIRIGESAVMLADEFPDQGYVSPATLGGSSVLLLVYVAEVDAVFERAVGMGATAMRAVSDQFDGDRRGTLIDPFGHIWILGTRREELSVDEVKARFKELMSGGSQSD
jgi:PhnB protein